MRRIIYIFISVTALLNLSSCTQNSIISDEHKKTLNDSIASESAYPKQVNFAETQDVINYRVPSPGTAERAFYDFLSAWQKKDWRLMLDNCQLTWVSNKTDAVDALESMFGFKELQEFTIDQSSCVTPNVVEDISATIKYPMFSEMCVKKIKARVICEISPYNPSSQGQWGVNPISVLREQ